jgi:hypothetical protein
MPNSFSSAKPYKDRDGSLRLYGLWSIRDHGPKFNKLSLANILLPDLAYAMQVNASWSGDGRQLLYVSIGYNTK